MRNFLISNMLLVALTLGASAYAETQTFTCSFPRYHSPDEGALQPAKDFLLVFKVDTISGDAFMEGNNGLASVFFVSGDDGATFLERLNSGAVQTTTFSKNGSAVHSRHTIISSDLVPSQYYGSCNAQ